MVTTTEELMTFVKNTLRLPGITPQSGMGKVRGWDSLKQLKLIQCLEQEFDLEIPDNLIAELTSIENILSHLREKGKLQ